MILNREKKLNGATSPEVSIEKVMPGSNGSATIIRCAKCDQTNSKDKQYCSACGAALWQKCLKCSAVCGVFETFCGTCGSNLPQLIQERVAQFELAIQKATEFRSAGHHDQALQQLKGLPDPGHVEVEKRHRMARQLATEIAQERDRLCTSYEAALKLAEQRHAEFKFKEAIQILQAVPAGFRDQRAAQLLESATVSYREIKRLRAEISADVDARQLLGLAPKIESYLALQPDDQNVKQLAERLRDSISKKVHESLAKCEYDNARKLLVSIPASASNEAVKQLTNEVLERCRLMLELRQAAIVNPFLVHIAERMRTISPGDQKIPKILMELNRRAQKGPANTRFPSIAWAVQPANNFLGMPVEWLGGFRRIRAESREVEAVLNGNPGTYFVAVGMALQGLECAAIPLNLMPAEKSPGLLKKISLFNKKQTASAAWGIDIGGSCLKAVRLVRDQQTQEVLIATSIRIPFGKHLFQADHELEITTVISDALRVLKAKQSISENEPVCINGPISKTLSRFFSVPGLVEKKLDELVKYEAAHQIPYPLHDLEWDYAVMDSSNDGLNPSEDGTCRIVLAALRSHDVRDRLRVFRECGLPVNSVQIDAIALHNFLAYDVFDAFSANPPKPNSVPPVAILDLGSDATDLVISSPTQTWFRTIRLGGDDINQGLVRQLKLTFAAAESLKSRPANVERMTAVLSVFDLVLTKWVGEIQRSLASSANEAGDCRAQRLWVCGGAAAQYGLLRFLQSGPTMTPMVESDEMRES